MRFTLAGILLLGVGCFTATAWAQADGQVESIGFNGYYRPNCWTPMKVRLTPKSGAGGMYKIGVMQEDLDRDKVLYSRPFTLTGNLEGTGGVAEPQRVWVYFKPQPRDIEDYRPGDTIQVFLYENKDGGRQLVKINLPPGAKIQTVDTMFTGADWERGNKLVLIVASSQSKWVDPYQRARGMGEDILMMRVTPNDLPGDAKGLEGVDAVVWLDADPAKAPEDSMSALEGWVRDGGKLLVCQGADWQKTKASFLDRMLPVDMEGTFDERDAKSLRRLAGMPDYELVALQAAQLKAKPGSVPGDQMELLDPFTWGGIQLIDPNLRKPVIIDPWEDLGDKHSPVIKSTPRQGAIVNMWSVGDVDAPYVARWLYGLGQVAWVAQDFGDPALVSKQRLRRFGWAKAWDRALDFHHDTRMDSTQEKSFLTPRAENRYESEFFWNYGKPDGTSPDLSQAIVPLMEHGSKGLGFVAIAVLFFIIYWILAGPGSYFFLLAQKKSHLSWMAYAVCAFVATGVTVLIVKVVLRGDPEVKHVSFVRIGPGGEAVVHSDFGLYIPRDGFQEIELKETSSQRASYVTPFPAHPKMIQSAAEVPSYGEYEVPVHDRASNEAPKISVPYKSTLKKFQAKWVGTMKGIAGAPSIGGAKLDVIAGKLTNETGMDLHSVYMIWVRKPTDQGNATTYDDVMAYLPDPYEKAAWPAGQTIDVGSLNFGPVPQNKAARDKQFIGDRGPLNSQWMPGVFRDALRTSLLSGSSGAADPDRAAVLLSVFDRITPMKADGPPPQNQQLADYTQSPRFDLFRRAGREFDASNAVGAGYLLILAKSDNAPLPFPMRVENIDRMQGQGTVYWQFILPLAGRQRDPATTQPSASAPLTTRPSEELLPRKADGSPASRPALIAPTAPGG
jgi:hypothetical protein